MRRKDREMSEDFALQIVDKCDYGTMALVGADGNPYCIPITLVRDQDWIYIHSAKEGEKVQSLKQNPNVCISCVGDTHKPHDKFTTEYESAVVRGKAEEVTEKDEMIHGLRLLCQRHSPSNMKEFDAAISGSLFRTGVWKIHIDSITGKRKKYGRDGKELKYGKMEDEQHD
ncbi:nitroimidazol reductase NimA-like FMN-containing flavoprotein (pyridoxamine 5'-phosphate oxidase superfamily) [Clostridiales Family XIII bacterium PM5-7]